VNRAIVTSYTGTEKVTNGFEWALLTTTGGLRNILKEIDENVNVMVTEKENFWESLFKAGAFIGGIWLAAEIIKALSKRVYRCPNCNNVIQERANPCPYCGVSLTWNI
jgi:rubrerythrin